MNTLASICIDGVAYGMILFMISVGLSVTMGLMRVVNLAHGGFAMLGGALAYFGMARLGLNFVSAAALAIVAVVALSAPMERLLYRPLYRMGELQQVLATIGITFLMIASISFWLGTSILEIRLPAALSGSVNLGFRTLPTDRVFVIVVGLVIIGALYLLVERTRFGVKLRAAVDERDAAACLGIDTSRIFSRTFALGAALAALGGIMGAGLLPIDAYYPLRYMVLFLVVVSVGGLGSIAGSFVAALGLGVLDTAARYLAPDYGTIFFYVAMIVILGWRPHGLLGRTEFSSLIPRNPWLRDFAMLLGMAVVAAAAYYAFPDNLAFATRVIIMMIFVLSLDFVLGVAGITTLGHSALFGAGAYAAGLCAAHGWSEPVLGLLAGAAAAVVVALLSGLFLMRTRGLTLLMLTIAVTEVLGELANKFSDITGGADELDISMGPIFGVFKFDFRGQVGYVYAACALLLVFALLRILVASPFGLAARGIKESPARMRAIGAPVYWRLVAIYAIGGAVAGVAGALSAQSTSLVSPAVFDFQLSADALIMLILGGGGRLYGGLLGTLVFMSVHQVAATVDPFNWLFVIGALLLAVVYGAPAGLLSLPDLVKRQLRFSR